MAEYRIELMFRKNRDMVFMLKVCYRIPSIIMYIVKNVPPAFMVYHRIRTGRGVNAREVHIHLKF